MNKKSVEKGTKILKNDGRKEPQKFCNFYLVSLISGLASKQLREKATPNTNFFV
jgi:hypothetical protein